MKASEQAQGPRRDRLVKNTASQYALQVAKYVLPFLTLPYLTRVLGAEGFGVRAFVLATMTFVQIGLDFGFSQYGSAHLVSLGSNRDSLARAVSGITHAKLILQTAVAVVFVIALVPPSLLSEDRIFTVLSLVAVMVSTLSPDFAFIAREQLGVFTTRYIASKGLGVLLTFLLVHSSADLWLLGAIDLTTAAIATGWTWFELHRRLDLYYSNAAWRSAGQHLRRAVAYFLPNLSGTVMAPAVTLTLGLFGDDVATVAYWSVTSTVLNAINSLYVPFSNALFSHMVNRYDRALVSRALIISIPAGLLLATGVFFSADFLMRILGGSEYLGGAYVLQAASPLVLLGVPVILLGWPILGAAGRVRELTVVSLSATGGMLVGIVVLVLGGWLSVLSITALRIGAECFLLAGRLYCAFRDHLIGFDSAPDSPLPTNSA